MRKLSTHQMGRKDAESFRAAPKFPLLFVLDNIRSGMNTGSLFRTADAFLLEGLILCGITGTPPHREINKTALGATETVSWKYAEHTTEAIRDLKEKGYTVLAMEQCRESINLKAFHPQKEEKYAVVFGNEVKGVSEDVLSLCDHFLEIPQFGTKHSMNVAVTAGIVAWSFHTRLSL